MQRLELDKYYQLDENKELHVPIKELAFCHVLETPFYLFWFLITQTQDFLSSWKLFFYLTSYFQSANKFYGFFLYELPLRLIFSTIVI